MILCATDAADRARKKGSSGAVGRAVHRDVDGAVRADGHSGRKVNGSVLGVWQAEKRMRTADLMMWAVAVKPQLQLVMYKADMARPEWHDASSQRAGFVRFLLLCCIVPKQGKPCCGVGQRPSRDRG